MRNKPNYLLLTFILILMTFQVHPQSFGWGGNSDGQLGLGDNEPFELLPTTITAVPNATDIDGGLAHTLFLLADGTVMASGRNVDGQIGDGTVDARFSPVAVSGLTNIISVSGGNSSSLALASDGKVWGWGQNFIGQLGTGMTGDDELTPVESMISNVKQVEAGNGHAVALKADGTVWTWGQNNFGQLGINSTTTNPTPTQIGSGITGFSNFVAVSAGARNSAALKSDGTVWVWGGNSRGQTGNGSLGGNQLVPVQNTTLSNIVQIATSNQHHVALKSDGTVWVWGSNLNGQVGNGFRGTNEPTPLQNTTMTDIIEIDTTRAEGAVHARRKDGAIFAWGDNLFASLGDGSRTDRVSPIQTSVGVGNAYLNSGQTFGFTSKPVFSVPTGINQEFVGRFVTMNFSNVTVAGNVSVTGIDPTATVLPVPSGYSIQTVQPAYELTKTATTSGNIEVCINAQNEVTPTEFAKLKLLHEEGGNLIDRTTSTNFGLKKVCGSVTSFSKFVIAKASSGGSTKFDFDGDSKTDISIFRPAPGQWWYLRSSDLSNVAFAFGTSSDKLVPADYTGDGKTDVAFWRESTGEWFILRSEDSSFFGFPFGASGDIPAPGDFDGDGKADAAVFRPSSATWFIQRSSDGGTTITPFGIAEDRPTIADFDGDGKDDIAIYRPSVSQWWQLRSSAGTIAYQFGASGDKTIQGDYTGDGKADVGIFRPSTGNWLILRSEDTSFFGFPFGTSTDIPSPGDYDGDGKTDAAVFRPSTNTWFYNGSTSGNVQLNFGVAGDIPIPNVYSVD